MPDAIHFPFCLSPYKNINPRGDRTGGVKMLALPQGREMARWASLFGAWGLRRQQGWSLPFLYA